MTAEKAMQRALDVPGVKHAEFTERNGVLTGVVYERHTGIEFDVRRDGIFWNVNDDDGRDFRALSLPAALRRAMEANA